MYNYVITNNKNLSKLQVELYSRFEKSPTIWERNWGFWWQAAGWTLKSWCAWNAWILLRIQTSHTRRSLLSLLHSAIIKHFSHVSLSERKCALWSAYELVRGWLPRNEFKSPENVCCPILDLRQCKGIFIFFLQVCVVCLTWVGDRWGSRGTKHPILPSMHV